MALPRSALRTLLVSVALLVAVQTGSFLLAPDPTGVVPLVPVLLTVALLAHALSTGNLGGLTSAVAGFLAVTLALFVALAVAPTSAVGVALPTATGTALQSLALVGTYAAAVG